jgi:hypothetical protein
MTIVRVERSDDPACLSSQQGPRLVNLLDPDEVVVTVHVSEMDDEIAVALSAEATRACKAHAFRRPHRTVDDVPAYEITGALLPPEEIPGGKLVHIEIANGELVVMLPETRISPEFAAHIDTLVNGISPIFYIR